MFSNPLVDVVMVTYNHEKYIEQAIVSVLEQISRYPFRLIIADDHSLDRTPDICLDYARKYPDTVICILQNDNLGIIRNYQCAFNVCEAKYIALLEGDDYWTDRHKLQKQIDILEKEEGIGLVYSNYDVLENNWIQPYRFPKVKNKCGFLYETLLRGNFIGPLTACFRRQLLTEYVDFDFLLNHHISSVDYVLWLELAVHSRFYYMKESTAVYRKLTSSISNTGDFTKKERFLSSSFTIVEHFLKKYPVNNPRLIARKSFNKLNLTLLYTALEAGNRSKVQEYAQRLEPTGIKEFLVTVLFSKINIMKVLRRLRIA